MYSTGHDRVAVVLVAEPRCKHDGELGSVTEARPLSQPTWCSEVRFWIHRQTAQKSSSPLRKVPDKSEFSLAPANNSDIEGFNS